MVKLFSSCILVIVFVFKSFATDLTGDWFGTRFQYDETKSKYIAEFEYKYQLKQEGTKVTGVAHIQSKSGNYADIAVRGFVEGNSFYFEEYEVIDAKRAEGFLWCLKKGVLHIETKDGMTSLYGATPSFVEFYGMECSGGVTQLSRNDQSISENEAKTIADKASDIEKSLNLAVYPNPFAERTQVTFTNQTSQLVVIDVIDIQGRVMASLENNVLDAGSYQYTFTPEPSSHTTYYYVRIKVGDKTISKAIQKWQGAVDVK